MSVRHKTSKEMSIYKGSEEYFEYTCDPCSTAGDHVEAKGFCMNCEDYLCGTCFRSHSRSRPSRDHVLLDKDNMPKKSNPFCDPCKTVGDEEEAVGYCTDCVDYMCSTCYRSHTRSAASKHHVLLDKDNMPRKRETLASAVSKLDIDKRDTVSENYIYNEVYTYIRDINVASADDVEDCYIVGIIIVSSNELILADYSNKSLKLVDAEKGVIKNSLKLEAEPDGVTMLSQDHVAVVLSNKCKINVVSVSGGLTIVRTLNTNGYCLDIKYINGQIYISFQTPVKFQVLQPSGAVYKTIKPDPEVLEYCTLPRYIAVSRDESMIYISDWKTSNVLCMDMNGKLVSKFNGELDEPGDVTISPSGSVYLCNRKQHVVYKMTPDLREATVILGRGDGLSVPVAMCFNTSNQHLYISSGSGKSKYRNFIKVYSWK